MTKLFTTAALRSYWGVTTVAPSLTQTADQTGPAMGMMGLQAGMGETRLTQEAAMNPFVFLFSILPAPALGALPPAYPERAPKAGFWVAAVSLGRCSCAFHEGN